MSNVEPLKAELTAISTSLERVETSRRKYMKLYEEDGIPTELFASRLGELKAEEAGLSTRKAEIEAELKESSAEPVTYDTVRETLARFNEVLSAAPPDQKKTLLQLIIRKVHLTADRKIDRIEISFDESVQTHFIVEALSADTGTEGAFPISGLVSGRRVVTPRFSLTL